LDMGSMFTVGNTQHLLYTVHYR